MSDRKFYGRLRIAAIVLIMVSAAALYFFRIDDIIEFCMSDNNTYLYLAQSLLSGRGFSNIYLTVPTPQTAFPPGYPMILAALIKIAGLNIPFIKTFIAIFYLLSALIFFIIMEREEKGAWRNVLVLALVAQSPFWLLNAREVVCDSVTTLFTALSFFMLQTALKSSRKDGFIQLTGLCIALCLAVRIMGLLVFAALVIYTIIAKEIDKSGRSRVIHAMMISVFPLAWIIFWSTLNKMAGSISGTDYISVFLGLDPTLEFHESLTFAGLLGRLHLNIAYFSRFIFSLFWPDSSLRDQILPGQFIFSALACLLLIIGIIRSWRGFARSWCLLTIIFLMTMLVWMERGPHFLNSVNAFLVLFLIEGISWLTGIAFPHTEKAKTIRRAVLTALALLWVGVIMYTDWNMSTWDLSHRDLPVVQVGPHFRMKPANPGTAEMLWLTQALQRRGIKPGDVVLSHSPMHLARLLGPVLLDIPWLPPEQMIKFMEQNKVTYVIADSIFPRTISQLYPVLQTYPDRFTKIAGDKRLISGVYIFNKEENHD